MKRLILFGFLLLLLLNACAPRLTTQPQELTVMTHDSFAVSESVIASFEQANDARVVFLSSGDTGSALNKAIFSKDTPLADVFYGVDNTLLSRALQADIFETYASAQLAEIPAELKLDSENRLLPVDHGFVCINYDRAYFTGHNLAVPQTLEDLTQPEYFGLLVVEDPTSAPGLAFIMATIAHFGPQGYLDYWQALRENGVVVVSDWNTAYYTNFSASSGHGPQPMVVSYASSPPAEVIFAEQPLSDSPTASILGPDTCFHQIEFAGILKGTQKRALAEKFVDFLLGVGFQEDIPLQMFMFPVNPDARLPEEFVRFGQVPDQPAILAADDIAANREIWIEAWMETVLR